MTNEELPKINLISYPNTVDVNFAQEFRLGKNCDEIKRIMKSGEMAGICWLQVWKDGEPVAEIKESVCNVYFV